MMRNPAKPDSAPIEKTDGGTKPDPLPKVPEEPPPAMPRKPPVPPVKPDSNFSDNPD